MATIEQHRAELAELARLANADLAVLWRHVTNGKVAFDLLNEVLPSLVDVYGSAAAAVAADWYDELRDAHEVPGRFTARTAELPAPDRLSSLAGWAASTIDPANPADALAATQGSVQRLITNAGRDTIIISALADPGAQGWQRSSSGGCGFCQSLAGTGVVYSRQAVDFGTHDHCKCVAVPAWEGHAAPVKRFTPAVTDADRARTHQWMAEHGY